MKLRAWQIAALEAVHKHIDERPVVWAVMGAGKSIAIAQLCLHYRQDIVIVTTPTVALVDQLATTLASVTGELIGQVYTHGKTLHRITVVCHGSIDLIDDMPDLWIADECHKTECDSVKAWAREYAPKRRVGFSATPWRNEERESVSLFDRCVYEYGPAQAYQDGVVVMPRLVYHVDDGNTVDEACVSFIASQDGPGVCNASTIEDAERFASRLSVPTLVVHSKNGVSAADACAFLALGGPRCVVYVSMLAEGFDCPCIQWLVARRKVGSRVRFAQEIGRGLRAYPGKTECLVFDPHRLFGRLSLSYEACLGVLPPRDRTVMPTLKLDEVGDDIADEMVKKGARDARFASRASDYLYEVRCELQFRGHVEMKMSKAASRRSARWRSNPPSEKQLQLVEALGRRAGRYSANWPPRVRQVLRLVWPEVPFLKSGAVSDLIEILKCADKIVD